MLFEREFRDPSTAYRLVPFWFWNGDMDSDEITYQIRQMAEKGIGGFFLCARQGLTVPYLSEEWFRRVALAVKTAQSYGLDVWLYDEYPYPSGMSGGEVTLQHPDARQCQLLQRTLTINGPHALSYELPWARVLLAQAVPLAETSTSSSNADTQDLAPYIGNGPTQAVFQTTGLTRYTNKRFFTADLGKQLRWDVPPGRWQITLFLEQEISEFKYFGDYVDPCHPAAVQTFLATTHERYSDHFREHFGKTIKGFFTDEVGLLSDIPWSSRLPAFFRDRYGDDLISCLPLLLSAQGDQSAQVRYRFFQSIHLLLRENYHQRISEWCDQQQLLYLTEVPSVRMTTQRYSHIPGGDCGHEKAGHSLAWIVDQYAYSLRGDPRIASSQAHQQGRERAMIECFHSVGWSMTLQDAKWMLDRLAASGITFFVLHAFFSSINGLRKHDAPPSQFLQNPYWGHFRLLADYAARLSYSMSQGQAEISIAIVHPATTFWTSMGNPFHAFRYCGNDATEERKLERLKRDWADLCQTLLLNQLDFDHLDPEMLAENALIEDRHLHIGAARYTVLILPPLTNLEMAAWTRIKDFLRAGGTVISVGLLPYEHIEQETQVETEMLAWFGLPDSPYYHYWQGFVKPPDPIGDDKLFQERSWMQGIYAAYFLPRSSSTGERLLSLLQRCAPPSVVLEPVEGDRRSFLMHQRRGSDGKRLIFITHQEGTEKVARLHLTNCSVRPSVERLDLATGQTQPLAVEQTCDGWSVLLIFAPYEAYMLRYSSAGKNQIGKRNRVEQPWSFSLDLQQPWTLTAQRANVVRLGRFHVGLDLDHTGRQQGWPTGQEARTWPLVEAKPFVNQCADLANERTFPMQFHQTFGVPMAATLAYPLHCWYHTIFQVVELPTACHLVMDEDAIRGTFTLYLNGAAITARDFAPTMAYGYRQLAYDIRHLLQSGANQLVIQVEIQKPEDGLCDPLYLSGPFGVTLNEAEGPVLNHAPATGYPRGGVQPGYPYYAGTLCFTRTVMVETTPREKMFVLDLKGWDPYLRDCVEILINGHTLGVRAWSPYRWEGSCRFLHEGPNSVEIRITNTLSAMLDGCYFDEKALKIVPVDN